MKFLFIAPRYHTNQIEIVKSLKWKKNKVYFNGIFRGKIEDYSQIKPFFLKQSLLSKLFELFLKTKHHKILYFPKINECYSSFKKIKPDIAIIRLYGRLYPYLAAIVLKMLKVKIIFYEQAPNDFSHIKKNKFKFLIKKFEMKIQNFLFNSIWITPIKKNNNFLKKCFYLPFVVKINKIIRNSKNIKILIIGKFQKRKSIYLALKALKLLEKKYNFQVTIIGEVSTQEHRVNYNNCYEYIRKNKLFSRIRLIKNLPYKNMNSYYKSHKLFVLPSKNEPASISLLEAIGNSMPVICSDTCGTRYYLKKNFSRIFKTDSINSLKKNIEFYLRNKKNYNKFSNNAYQHAYKNLSKKNYINNLNYILKKIND